MGILPFQKKKKKTASKSSKGAATTTAAPASNSNVVTPPTEVKTKWSPIRKLRTVTKPPVSPKAASVVPPTVPVVSNDRVEVMTLESQRALMEQREAIRKKLFESSSNHDDDDSLYTDGSLSDGGGNRSSGMKRAATNASHEVTPSGKVRAAKAESPYDRFSIPIHPAASSSWDGSLQKLAEEPVRYSRESRSAPGPISLDHSFTESELASVISQPIITPSSARPEELLATVDASPDSSSAAAVVSPANTTRSSIAPMDERVEDLELQKALNTGKSPLKGMPDDERLEYQKDEMETLPPTPQRAVGGSWASLSPFQLLQARGEMKSDSVVASEGTKSAALPSDQNLQTSLSTRLPELGRSIARATYECGSGALSNVLPSAKNDFDVPVDTPPPSSDETASLTTLTLNSTLKRPTYLDEASVIRFLRRITKNGFVLLYLQAPEGSGDDTNYTDDWKGRTVTMMIQKGQLAIGGGNAERDVESTDPPSPQLEWTTVTGGQTFESTTTSISLLNILSIATNDDEVEDEDMCFFTVTSEDGEVHIFETATLEERDRIVNGLKTLIARWSFQVIAGDITATSELFESRHGVPSLSEDMPSLPNPNLTLNSVAHMLLDSES